MFLIRVLGIKERMNESQEIFENVFNLKWVC